MRGSRATFLLASAVTLVATLLATIAPAAPSAPLADIRQTPLLDDFNRPNENPLSGGGNWARADLSLWSPLELRGNAVTHQSGASPSHSYWTPESFSGDVEAWARGSGGGANGIAWRVALFKDVGGSNTVDGYRFGVEVSSGGASYQLRRFDNGVQTGLASAGGAVQGGWILIRRNGDRVEGWRSSDGTNWTLAVSATDTTYTTGL